MKASELIKRIEHGGWFFVRQSGSHKIFKHLSSAKNISIPDRGKKDIPKGTLKRILKDSIV